MPEPAPPPRSADVASTQRALATMPPRHRQVLLRRFVERRTRPEFAALYGLDEPHADLLVWKAVVSFEAALSHREPPQPIEVSREFDAAAALARALDSGQPPPTLRALVDEPDALAQVLAREEAEAETSVARTREDWLRRLAIVLIALAAGYFYWRDHYGPKERKPPEARVPPPGHSPP